MIVRQKEIILNFLEGGLTEFLTNKLMNVDMNKHEIIIDGTVCSNYIRVISFEEWEWDFERNEAVLVNKVFKLQIKIYGFLLSKYHTIKEWNDFDIDDKAAEELAKNDAIELFNNIINPYKYHG